MNCYNHPQNPAEFQCISCGLLVCKQCVKSFHAGGFFTYFCPGCNSQCEEIEIKSPPKIPDEKRKIQNPPPKVEPKEKENVTNVSQSVSGEKEKSIKNSPSLLNQKQDLKKISTNQVSTSMPSTIEKEKKSPPSTKPEISPEVNESQDISSVPKKGVETGAIPGTNSPPVIPKKPIGMGPIPSAKDKSLADKSFDRGKPAIKGAFEDCQIPSDPEGTDSIESFSCGIENMETKNIDLSSLTPRLKKTASSNQVPVMGMDEVNILEQSSDSLDIPQLKTPSLFVSLKEIFFKPGLGLKNTVFILHKSVPFRMKLMLVMLVLFTISGALQVNRFSPAFHFLIFFLEVLSFSILLNTGIRLLGKNDFPFLMAFLISTLVSLLSAIQQVLLFPFLKINIVFGIWSVCGLMLLFKFWIFIKGFREFQCGFLTVFLLLLVACFGSMLVKTLLIQMII